MEPISDAFQERLAEIDAYLALLTAIEDQVKDNPHQVAPLPITTQQQKILYSTVYLLLYNLVEATATWCIDAVTRAASKKASLPGQLCAGLRREWVRFTARTHVDLNHEKRLKAAVDLCEYLIGSLPVHDRWRFARGLGNWDDHEIESITARIECELQITAVVRTGIKRKIRDDKAPLELVRDLRNRLAHGSISFEQCGEGITVEDLKDLTDKTAAYLSEVVAQFQAYIDGCMFLEPGCRPVTGADA